MSYTYLSLCNKLAAEAGVSGNASAISTTVGQTGEAKRICGWVKDAHTEIQNRHKQWRWMRSRWTVDTVAGTDSYAPTSCTDSRLNAAISRFANWWPFDESGCINMTRYLTSGGVSGESWMTVIPWDYFRSIYRLGTQNNGQIIHVTIDPQNNLVFGPKPDAIYTCQGEYQMSALEFSADSDAPEMPSRYQDVIWLKALEKYGRYHAALEALSRAEVEGTRLMRELEADQLPQIGLGAPLV